VVAVEKSIGMRLGEERFMASVRREPRDGVNDVGWIGRSVGPDDARGTRPAERDNGGARFAKTTLNKSQRFRLSQLQQDIPLVVNYSTAPQEPRKQIENAKDSNPQRIGLRTREERRVSFSRGGSGSKVDRTPSPVNVWGRVLSQRPAMAKGWRSGKKTKKMQRACKALHTICGVR